MFTLNRFKDRAQAGELLAQRLSSYAGRNDVIVLGLPRGGVPVASVLAKKLQLPLDIILVRKLGMPGQEEFALGAIASGGTRYLQEDVVRAYAIPEASIDQVVTREMAELERREKAYRSARPALPLQGRVLILVDDGLATGSTMKAALLAVRKQQPARVIVAVPVAPPQSVAKLGEDADEIICLRTPEPFFAVGSWYENFGQTSDEEVIRLLSESASEYAHPQLRQEVSDHVGTA
jgi:putative phosphoribosyl transferase